MPEGRVFDVFMSYSRADTDAVRRVQARLKDAGLETFLDLDALSAGQPWLPALEKAIAQCGAVAVFVGPSGLGIWQHRELQLALDRQANAERQGHNLPVIPVLLPQCQDPPGGFLSLNTWVDLRADLSDATQLDLLLAGIRGHAPGDGGQKVRSAICPYRGLLAFREEDADLFFGRDEEVVELVEKVGESSIVTVVGRSGSGKSSVVYAGLIPALRRRADGRTWAVRSLRPGLDPLHALVRTFDPPSGDLAPFVADKRIEEQAAILRNEDGALGRRVRRLLEDAAEHGTDQLLLYIDQWEELYTQALSSPTSDPEQARKDITRFIDLILDAAAHSACTVVITVRADFYRDVLKHGALSAAIPRGLVNLGPMNRDDVAATIRKPAEFISLRVDEPLVEEMLDEVGEDLAKLPLLEHALKETWQRREGDRLTLSAYGEAGGIDGAIAQRANDIFARLGIAEQEAARRLFVSLVSPGEGREDTRVRVTYPEDDEAIRTVVGAFSDASARLLVTGTESGSSQQRMVEISHEALIREWDRLQEWVAANRETLRRREHIRARMRQWEEQQRDQTLLLSPGLPLEEGRKLLADPGDVLINDLRPFIETSIALDKERRASEQRRTEEDQRRKVVDEQARRESERAASTNRRRFLVALGAVAVTIVLLFATAFFFLDARAQANRTREALGTVGFVTAVGEIGSGRAAPGLAQLAATIRIAPKSAAARSLAVATLSQRTWFLPLTLWHKGLGGSVQVGSDGARVADVSPSGTRVGGTRAMEVLGQPLPHAGWVTSAEFSRDGTRVVTASEDWTARVWDASTGAAVGGPLQHRGPVYSAEFNSAATRVVTASADQTARVWDASTGAAVGEPLQHEGPIYSAQFNSDGKRVVTASEDGTARVWDASTGTAVGGPLQHEGPVYSAEFSPDGNRVLSASADQTARVWDASTGAAVGTPIRHQGPVLSARFSSDGSRVVTASEDQTAGVWDASSGAANGQPMRHRDAVTSVLFGSEDTLVVTASADRTARVWDARTGVSVTEPLRHEALVNSATFSPDGTRVATASEDHTVRMWEARSGKALGEPLRHHDAVISAQFSPDGTRLVTASADGPQMWDAGAGAAMSVPLRHGAPVVSAQFSPEGARVVTASVDGTARVWDASTGAAVGGPLQHRGPVYSAEFNSAATRVVTASADQTARVWDASTGTAVGEPLQHEGPIYSAQFNSDGNRVVTASEDGTARVWDASTGTAVGGPLQHEGPVYSAQFNPNCQRVVTASADGTARLWDARTWVAVATLLHTGPVASAQFSPDGTRVVTASADQMARLWNATNGAAVAKPLRHMGPVALAQFSPDGTRVVTASGDQTARVWDARTGMPLSEPLRHEALVISAQFGPDGTRIVTASEDQTARVWDARTGAALSEPLRHNAALASAQFSPDGKRVVTASRDGAARVWDAINPSPADAETLAALAEAVGGLRVNEFGAAVPVTDQIQQLDDLRAKAKSKDKISNDPAFEAFFRWFFEDPAIRKISPLSAMTQEDYRKRMTPAEHTTAEE